ncbi:MAG: hypothetical protein IKH11_08710 [Bacteroidales bacterium]|nr:hypothetical protein [Bacteroidales bacterium]
MKLRYLFGILLLGLVACEVEKPETETLSEIQVQESYVSIDVNGGSAQLQFTATDSWSIDETSLGGWITASPMSGAAGAANVQLSAEATKATRSAELKINCGGRTQYVNVIQYAQKADPVIMSVPEAIALIKTVDKGDGQSYNVDGEYYVKGIVCKIDEISVSYGNATYYLSEDGKFEDGKWLEVYRGYWLNEAKFTSGDEFAVGDELTIAGQLMSYKGTPETVQNTARVISVKKSLISVDELGFDKLPAIDTTFNLVVTAKESPLLISSDSDWLQIVDVNANGSYKLHADENLRTAERTANISISGPTARKSVSITQKGVEATGSTVTEIIAAADNDQVQTLADKTTTVAKTTKGIVVSDGTNAIYVYSDKVADVVVGDNVRISGTKTTYNGVPELTNLTDVFVDSKGNAVEYPQAKDITDEAGTYKAAKAEFVKLSGTLNVSGNYYNINLDAFQDGSKQGSIVYPVDELNAKGFNGKKITVTGYFNGLSSKDKYINIIATKIVEFVDNPKGTVTNPYSASEIAQLITSGTTFSEDVYIKGKVSAILYTFSASYGTGTFWISDDGTAYGVSADKKKTDAPTKDFECYSVVWFNNTPWADGNAQVEVGDEVVVCGKTTLYNGVAETSNKKAWVYSVNGATTDANGLGNAGAPFNIAGAKAFIDAKVAAEAAAKEAGASEPVFPDVCVKGKISNVVYTFSASYGTATFWMSDDGSANDFEAYSVYYFNNQPWAEGNKQVAVGDEVVVKGQLTLFKSTYETSSKEAWLYSLNGATE